MKITVTAFLFAEWNMEVNHKKKLRFTGAPKYCNRSLLISVTSYVNEVIKVIPQTDHKTVTTVFGNIRKTDVIGSTNHNFVQIYLHNGCNT
jgi:hypothetical protein